MFFVKFFNALFYINKVFDITNGRQIRDDIMAERIGKYTVVLESYPCIISYFLSPSETNPTHSVGIKNDR